MSVVTTFLKKGTNDMGEAVARLDHPEYGPVTKRSIGIAGHRTSVSLEDMFWRELRAIAYRRHVNTSSLVTEIGARCGPNGLSSAIRQFVIFELQKMQSAGASPSAFSADDDAVSPRAMATKANVRHL